MNRKVLNLIVSLVALGILAFVVVRTVQMRRGRETQADIDAATRDALQRAQLLQLPASAEEFSINLNSSFFSRDYRLGFTAPPGDIDQWLKASPGTKGLAPVDSAPGVRRYEISTGGKKQAEVEVRDGGRRVTIQVGGE